MEAEVWSDHAPPPDRRQGDVGIGRTTPGTAQTVPIDVPDLGWIAVDHQHVLKIRRRLP